jgi:hypothetical protein
LTPEISNTEGRKGRWRGAFVWLSFPIVLLLVWPWTWNCYFSIKIYDSLFWVLPALLLILSTGWFAVFMRISSKRNFEARALGSSGKRSIGRALYYSAFFGLVFGSVTLMPIDLCALSMVYATSRTSVRFSSPISVRKNSVGGGRSCVYYLIFYNSPVEREITVCGERWNIGGAKSGDTLAFEEMVGPMGARLIGIRRAPN